MRNDTLKVINDTLKMKNEKLKMKNEKRKVEEKFLFSIFSSMLKKTGIFHFSLSSFHLKEVFIFSFSFFTFHLLSAQQLETLIQEGLANNTEIQLFELKHEVAKEKINEVNAIPNTEFGVGYFVSEPETRTGAQRFKLSAKQMLPSFGSITARKNYKKSLADAVYEDIAIVKRKLIASISQSYYHLYTLKKKQSILDKNSALLKTYEELALNVVEVGKASVVDVLRLQMRQNELEQLKQILVQDALAAQTVLNKLLNRDKNKAILVVDELIMASENELINSENLALHPELLKYDKLYQSIEKSELLNQKESKPMFGFGLDYIAVSERPNMSFNDNGKDIIMPMVSVSIPIFNKKYKSKTKQHELFQKEVKFQKQDKLNRLETMLDKAVKRSNSAKISYNTQSKNLQKAKDAEAILMKNYETGTIDFKDVLDVQELQLKFQISQIESVKTYYIQRTIINYLTQQ